MNKKEIAKKVSVILGINQNEVLKILDKIFEVIVSSLTDGNDVLISKFGKFRIKKTKEKNGRNPKTGEIINVSEGYKILFKVSEILKEYLNTQNIKKK